MKFFLTGATGFIGSHLTKTLVRQGEHTTILVNKTPRLDFFEQNQENIRTVKVELLDSDKIAKEMAGHDVVVHLAYGNRGTPEQQYQITVEGTRSVLRAAIEAKVKRFVHISTISVYGEPPKTRTYTEETPRYASLGLYPSLKQEAEVAVLNSPHEHTEVVVLQPGIVYGPGGGYWTERILNILQKKRFPLINGGQGLCNLIHVYDVVDAIILAATTPGIDRECFILTNDTPVTWATFFGAYEKILAKKCLINLPDRFMKTNRLESKVYKRYHRVLQKFFKVFPSNYGYQPVEFLNNNERIDFFTAQPFFSNRKIRELLGFNPRMDLEEGMRTVKEWVNSSKSLETKAL